MDQVCLVQNLESKFVLEFECRDHIVVDAVYECTAKQYDLQDYAHKWLLDFSLPPNPAVSMSEKYLVHKNENCVVAHAVVSRCFLRVLEHLTRWQINEVIDVLISLQVCVDFSHFPRDRGGRQLFVFLEYHAMKKQLCRL